MRDLLAAALATGPLRRLQVGWAAASVGGWTFMVALAVYAHDEGGVTAVGLAAMVRMVPAGLFAPFAGVIADRRPRRDVLVWSTAARALLLVAIAGAVAGDAPFGLVLVLAAGFTVAQTLHRPAQMGMLPFLARTPTQLAAANAVATGVDNAAFLAGALLGGVLVAATSAQTGFLVTAGAFLGAAVVLRLLPRDPVPAYREAAGFVREEIREGFRAVSRDPSLRTVMGVLSLSTLVEGVIDVLVVVTAIELVSMGTAGVGWLNAAWGLGGLVGGGFALYLLGRGRLATGLALGASMAGVSLLAIAGIPTAVVAVGALVVLGVGYAVMEIAGLTLLQRLPSDEVLCRTTSVMESAYWITTGLGGLLAPVLVSALGARTSLLVVGLALPLFVLARRAALARLEMARAVPERPFVLLRGLEIFAPVPIGTVENLALRMQECTVPPGRRVVVEGDRGDWFYVVSDGTLEITRDGAYRDTIGGGDFFGEIALLRGVPRTATVTARSQCVLYGLEREVFLDALGGHSRAGEAAEAAASAHSWGMPAEVAGR